MTWIYRAWDKHWKEIISTRIPTSENVKSDTQNKHLIIFEYYLVWLESSRHIVIQFGHNVDTCLICIQPCRNILFTIHPIRLNLTDIILAYFNRRLIWCVCFFVRRACWHAWPASVLGRRQHKCSLKCGYVHCGLDERRNACRMSCRTPSSVVHWHAELTT